MAAVIEPAIKQAVSKPPRHYELSKLPKAHRFKSFQGSYQTPGALEPFFHDNNAYHPSRYIDPSHPGTRKPPMRFPHVWDAERTMGAKIRPLGLLVREARPFAPIPILTWTDRVKWARAVGITGNPDPRATTPKLPPTWPSEAASAQLYPPEDYNNFIIPPRKVTPKGCFLQLALERAGKRVPLSLHVATSKKRMGQDRHMRKRIETRLRGAINLVITRGASVGPSNDGTKGEPRIILSDADAGRHWVVHGWAYMFYPTSEVYNMPLTTLIPKVRSVLAELNHKALQIENKWLNQSLLQYAEEQDVGPWNPLLQVDNGARTTLREEKSDESKKGDLNADEASAPVGLSNASSKAQPSKRKPATFRNTYQWKKLPAVWKEELLQGLSLIKQRISPPDGAPAQDDAPR